MFTVCSLYFPSINRLCSTVGLCEPALLWFKADAVLSECSVSNWNICCHRLWLSSSVCIRALLSFLVWSKFSDLQVLSCVWMLWEIVALYSSIGLFSTKWLMTPLSQTFVLNIYDATQRKRVLKRACYWKKCCVTYNNNNQKCLSKVRYSSWLVLWPGPYG